MKLCACGCGEEVKNETSKFLPGHQSKLRSSMAQAEKIISSEKKEQYPEIIKTVLPIPEKKNSNTMYYMLIFIFLVAGIVQYTFWSFLKMHIILLIIFYALDLFILVFLLWTVYRLRKKQEPVIFKDLEDFIKQVPKWAIDTASPKSGIVGKFINAGKDYIQIVLVSTHFEPKAVWAEWDGFMFRIGNRAYIPPRDIRGDTFFYHIDKKTPLIDSAEATNEDAEDSYQLLAVWNQAFSVGHAAALSETQGYIKIILIIVIAIAVMILALGVYSYAQFSEINKVLETAGRAITLYIQEHP